MHLNISLCLHDSFIIAIDHDQAQTESADFFILFFYAVVLGEV